MAKKFYETEILVAVVTEHGEFRYYKESKKIQVSLAKWKSLDGETHHGKTVTLDLKNFKGNEELKSLLNLILVDLDEEPDKT